MEGGGLPSPPFVEKARRVPVFFFFQFSLEMREGISDSLFLHLFPAALFFSPLQRISMRNKAGFPPPTSPQSRFEDPFSTVALAIITAGNPTRNDQPNHHAAACESAPASVTTFAA